MKTFQIITNDNGVGLSQDLRLLTGILTELGHEVIYTHHQHPPKKADVNIFLEIMVGAAMRFAEKNILIPNPEWFEQVWRKYARQCDAIWCKTRHAEKVFRRFGNAVHIGWTSRDMFRAVPIDKDTKKNDLDCLHLAGSSMMKNSPEALSGWYNSMSKNIKVITRKRAGQMRKQLGQVPMGATVLSNLHDGQLAQEMYKCGIHLCPSSCEGWGHYIVEAMSTGAIVITTDKGPMNEIVQPDRGILVPGTAKGSQMWSQKWGVNPADISAAIDRVVAMEEQQRATMGANAREWYLKNDRTFRERIVQLIQGL